MVENGERAHAARRKRFWGTLLIGAVTAVPLGFGVGYGAGYSRGNLDTFFDWAPDALVIGFVMLAIAGLLYGSWRFLQIIDEVELQDNLWASTAAYYAYGVGFPAWWALAKAGIVAEPSGWTLYLGSMAIGLFEYLRRKWIAR